MPLEKLKNSMLWLGPIIASILYMVTQLYGWEFAASFTASITILSAIWWVFEPVPIPVTSLLPLALFPLFGILDKTQVAESYGNPLILLLLGGFILSTVMQHSGAHKRIALGMINIFGGRGQRRVVFGFMFASAMLSMWISNTATTLMLLPVVLAVLQNTRDQSLAIPLLLGVCYAASLGGVATPIGTPPNLIFMRVYTEHTGIELSFTQWMRWGVPVVIIFLPIMYWWLTRNLSSEESIEVPASERWNTYQKRVVAVFIVTAIAWVTRKEPFGGWSVWFDLPTATDASVALLAVIAMFIVPDGRGGRLLDWQTANRIPWGMLLLFAGGIAIAKAFTTSGLAAELADSLTLLSLLPILLVIATICLLVTFLTEMTSNTATTALLMPVLAIAASTMQVDPALLMVPAALSASCAFMLPVATVPNAVIFGSGKVPMSAMIKFGFGLNLFGVIVVSSVCYVLLG